MTRPVCLQIYISHDLSARIRKVAGARNLSKSEWARSLLNAACDDDDSGSRIGGSIERIARQGVFAMVGIDALLAGHSDPQLRERAHQAYVRKCRELGLANSSERSDSNEA
jgi:hypothetical protein